MVAAADSQYYGLQDLVSTAVFTGCRRSFILIDYQDIAEVSRLKPDSHYSAFTYQTVSGRSAIEWQPFTVTPNV